MPTTSALQAIPLPDASDAANVPYAMSQAINNLEKKLVMVYATAAARDAAIPAPVEGMAAWLQDANLLTFYDGAAWRTLSKPFDAVSTLVTASSAAIGGTETTLATLPSFTTDGSTVVETAFSWYDFSASTGPVTFFLRLYDGATQIAQSLLVVPGATSGLANTGGGHMRTLWTPSAGAHAAVTAKLVRNGGTTETLTLLAGATDPAVLTARPFA